MLWKKTGEKPIELKIKKRTWKWIGHFVRNYINAVERIVLDWNPQGKRKRGRPKKIWKMSVVEKAQREGRTWEGDEVAGSGLSKW
jgi:hypothetical protein